MSSQSLLFIVDVFQDLPRLAPEFCEQLQPQGIAQPANAWSSLAYCVAGIWLMLRRQPQDGRLLKLMGPIAISIGLSSFAYHALYTPAMHFFDLFSMFLFSTLIFVFNLVRARIIPRKLQMPLWSTMVTISGLALMWSLQIGRTIFGLGITLSLLCEIYLAKQRNHSQYRDFLIALSLFAIAFVIWNLDLHKIVCDPHNHFLQGHAIWHILTALSLIFVTRFYRQFTILK